MTLVLTVATLLLQNYAKERANEAARTVGRTVGQAVLDISNVMGTYITKFADSLMLGTPIPGVANPMEPTMAELQALGLPHATFGTVSPVGGNYRMRVVKLPVGCVGTDCNLATRVWLDQPILNELGQPDGRRLIAAGNAIGADGGFSERATPGTIYYGGGWTSENPDAAQRAGIVSAVNGYQSSMWGSFVRIRDTRDPNLQGNLTVAGDIAGNKITANTIVSNGDLVMNGAAPQGAACSTPFATRRNSTTNAGWVICDGTRWQPIGTAVTNVTEGTVCSINGQTATNVNNQQYVCKNGYYVSITSLIPKNVEMARYVHGDNNVTVPKPTCAAGGTPSFSMEARTMGADFTQAPPFTAVRYGADDYGWAWVPRILLVNMNGATESGNVLGLQGVFKVECYYP
ncbi:hypothetical protein [Cupriavidus pauculus]|uniref:hypothetical protein n=1 Tax=Cupriavidus pauculus TaxID=82633 RepID=UPI0038571AE8